MNIHMQVFVVCFLCEHKFLFLWDEYIGMELLDCMVAACLVL